MYVGDRDTYDDVFCFECGNIADRETLNDDGLCKQCKIKLVTDCLKVLQKTYWTVIEPNGTIEIRNSDNRPVRTFENWFEVRDFINEPKGGDAK